MTPEIHLQIIKDRWPANYAVAADQWPGTAYEDVHWLLGQLAAAKNEIHEWEESDAVARSGVLDRAMQEPLDVQPLPHPRDVVAVHDGQTMTPDERMEQIQARVSLALSNWQQFFHGRLYGEDVPWLLDQLAAATTRAKAAERERDQRIDQLMRRTDERNAIVAQIEAHKYDRLGDAEAARDAALKQAAEAMGDRDRLREALTEVVALSDRNHHAWDKAHAALAGTPAPAESTPNHRRFWPYGPKPLNEPAPATSSPCVRRSCEHGLLLHYHDDNGTAVFEDGTPVMSSDLSLGPELMAEETQYLTSAPATFADRYRAGLEAAADLVTYRSKRNGGLLTETGCVLEEAARMIRALPAKEGTDA